jgi:hypothetical protein
MNKKIALHFPAVARLLASLPALFAGCSFYSRSVALQVVLPQPPRHWQAAFPSLRYRIVIPDPAGGCTRLYTAGQDRAPVVELPKLVNQPLLAYPEVPDRGLELPPAGGLYPLDCDLTTSRIRLSWEQGMIAEILARLWSRGVPCSGLNTPRLRREVEERSNGDPWSLDLNRLLAALAEGEFRVTDIRCAACRELVLDPGAGLWFLESPFRRPAAVESGEELKLSSVPLGFHLLIESSGPVMSIYLAEDSLLILPFDG